jgi:hypothetical protein
LLYQKTIGPTLSGNPYDLPSLSRERFTSFAKIEEVYYPHNSIWAKAHDTRLAAARLHEGILSFQFTVSQRERFHSGIMVALGSSSENGRRLSLSLPFRSGKAQIWDTITGRRSDDAIVQWRGSKLFVDIPVSGTPDFDVIYTKLLGWTLFFDRSGWSQFTITSNFVREANVPGLLTLL